MSDFEAQPGLRHRTEEELPSNKSKFLTPPDMPTLVVVENSNSQRNPAHREITYQVKLPDRSTWEEPETLDWLGSQTYETGLQSFAVRNTGTATFNLKYPATRTE